MHPFRKFILNYSALSEQEWEQVEARLILKQYKKGKALLKEGQICNKLYFLEEGFLRFYIYNNKKSVTKFFTEAPYCFTSQRSFSNYIPSKENIEVLENSTIWEMNKSDAFDLLAIPKWSEFIRKLIQEVQFYTEQILEEAQNSTAEERYVKMIEENSSIIAKASSKHIASYLGIAPQSLSRIRKKYWEQSRS